MSLKLCCLCCNSCSEFKSLKNFWGESNEVYKITVKYFDPLLLKGNGNNIPLKLKRVLCLNCWLHIKDFHKFHETILKARSSLEQTTLIKKSELDKSQSVLEKEDAKLISNNKYHDGAIYVLQSNLKGDSAIIHEDGMHCEGVPLNEDNKHPNEQQNSMSLSNDKVEASIEDAPSSIGSDSDMVNNDVMHSNKYVYNSILDDSEIIKDIDDIPLSELMIKDTNSEKQIKNLQNEETNSFNKLNKKDIKKPRSKQNRKDYFKELREKDEFIRKWKSELDCDICGEKCPLYENLLQHFKRKHSNVKCYVKCCSRKHYLRCGVVEHINVHINPETYKCNICGKLSTTKALHKSHTDTHEENRSKFECNVCQKTFKQKITLKHHILTHVTGSEDFKCNLCDKAFVVNNLLKKHIQEHHNRIRICDTCGKSFRSSGAFRQHVAAQHSAIARPKHPCDVCGLHLVSAYSLKQHKAAYHNDGSTVYVCSICDKVKGSERALSFHIRYSHVYESKHKCPHCSKAFKRPQPLREHIATHTGEALYFCDLCPQTFKIQKKRSAHRKKFHPIEWRKDKKVILEKKEIDMSLVKHKVVV